MISERELDHPFSQTFAIVQIGSMGIVVPTDASAFPELQRDDWVVCKTGRGLELGVVRDVNLNARSVFGPETYPIRLERLASDSDRLAHSRLVAKKSAGLDACSDWLALQGRPEILLDVDVTLDGQRLYFHFLGEPNSLSNQLEEELARIYDQATGIREFTLAVEQGCGPTCGSDGSGCQTNGGCGAGEAGATKTGCSQCGLKSQCMPRR